MKPKPFNVLLTEAHRAELERMRIAFGCRSHGDALRALIECQAWEASDDAKHGVGPIAPVERLEPQEPSAKKQPTAVARQKIVSRLKGEWKAP